LNCYSSHLVTNKLFKRREFTPDRKKRHKRSLHTCPVHPSASPRSKTKTIHRRKQTSTDRISNKSGPGFTNGHHGITYPQNIRNVVRSQCLSLETVSEDQQCQRPDQGYLCNITSQRFPPRRVQRQQIRCRFHNSQICVLSSSSLESRWADHIPRFVASFPRRHNCWFGDIC
jgi:hypothetical protein